MTSYVAFHKEFNENLQIWITHTEEEEGAIIWIYVFV